MPEGVVLALTFLAGAALGVVFYGGLWLTVRRLPRSKHPVLFSVASFWARTLVVMGGFLAAMDRRWQNALFCLLGFAAARPIVSGWLSRRARAEKGGV